MTEPQRLASMAGSLALALSLVIAPAAMAQDDPTATVQEFIDAVVAKDFESLPSYFCEEQAGQAAQFDMSGLVAGLPPEMMESLMDAFDLGFDVDSLDVVSESESEAIVHIVGSMSMEIDPEPLMPFIEMVLSMAGEEVTAEAVENALDEAVGEFEAETQAIDLDVTLVPGEERPWLICSGLEFGDGMVDDGMDTASAEPSDDAGDDSE